MSRFILGIFGYDGTLPHSRCFEDFAFALRDALRALGHELYAGNVVDARPSDGRMIWLGANNPAIDKRGATEWKYRLPDDAIIFNSEQLSAVDDPERYMQNYSWYRKHVVWDYSLANIATLKRLGIERAVHCPLGYIESMTRFKNKPAEEQDIDVLFYGSTNPHRLKILDGIKAAGLNLVMLDPNANGGRGVYGEERDAWIARAKIVLNMHHYERGVFEIFRVSHLVANHKCVVNEDGGVDEELNKLARLLTLSVKYEDIVDVVARLVKETPQRCEVIANNAFDHFARMSLVDYVKAALEQS